MVIAVVPEDSGGQAMAVVAALTSAAASLTGVAPTIQAIDERWAESVRSGLWKGQGKHKHHAIQLVRGLATWLAEHPADVIVIHFDGDVEWRHRRESENRHMFKRAIVDPLLRILSLRSQEEARNRVVAMVPHWNIEAWTYRNFQELHPIAERERDRVLLERIARWRLEPGSLDEEARPRNWDESAIVGTFDWCRTTGPHDRPNLMGSHSPSLLRISLQP